MSKPMASRVVGIGPTWLDRRQMGFKNPLGTSSHIYEQMYSNILPCGCWDHSLNNTYTSVHGAVFSLEFSPEGSLLVAACEKRSILLFDPLTHKRINAVENAHLDCVNCVRFLDSKSFATCSDDFTVALWDARNLSQKVRSLRGHSNWVKNIEYSPKDGLLVTSGFDGSILTWEMNKYTEDGIVHNKVFSTNGLMRTCLTPDASKMIMCTTGGYLLIIHNLDLNSLKQDLDGFKPNMYRLMQLSQTIIPIASDFTHLFRGPGKRNRLEFITDFPEGDDAEVVSSLQIHPDGHSAISRNASNNEESEWSCIHNIEERLSSDESDCTDDEDEDSDGCKTVTWPGTSASISTTPSYIIQHTVAQNIQASSRSDAGTGTEHRDLPVSPSDVWEALVAIQEARIRRETDRMASEMSVGHMFRRQAIDAGIQVRPLNSQIFVTRIMPNLGSSNDSEDRTLRNPGPVFRRNASMNTMESGRRPKYWPSIRGSHRKGTRKKLPVVHRYGSLYRRSLVGLYDRTSILRKPIYYPRVNELKIRKLRGSIKLNTNYELNETRRLQNESVRYGAPTAFDAVREEASGSRSSIADEESGRGTSSSRSSVRSGSGRVSAAEEGQREVVGSALRSWRQDLSSIQNNLNSFRETITTLEGTINSALRRSVGELVTNSSGSSDNSDGVMRGVEDHEDEGAGVGEGVDHEEVIEESSVNEDSPRTETPESATLRRPSAPSSPTNTANGERTILMGVFRAGNDDGVRGTSMRRHNVAAVTVSSPPQRITNPVDNSHQCGRNRRRCSYSCRNNGSHNNHSSHNHSTSNNNNNNNNNCSAKRYPLVPVNKKIHQNTKRLTHYIMEPNLGRSFIKELCVSPDGRIICSPFGNGIRLLSFSPTVQDILHCYPQSPPIPLHELTLNIAHTDIVVSTKFSPFHNLLVSGCLSGKIVYYQPFL